MTAILLTQLAGLLDILVADDNVDSADSLAMLLRLQWHQVDVVHDGVEALRRLQELRRNLR